MFFFIHSQINASKKNIQCNDAEQSLVRPVKVNYLASSKKERIVIKKNLQINTKNPHYKNTQILYSREHTKKFMFPELPPEPTPPPSSQRTCLLQDYFILVYVFPIWIKTKCKRMKDIPEMLEGSPKRLSKLSKSSYWASRGTKMKLI